MLEYDGDLFVGGGEKHVGAVGLGGVVGGVAGGVELPLLAGGAAVREGATAIGCCGSGDTVFWKRQKNSCFIENCGNVAGNNVLQY